MYQQQYGDVGLMAAQYPYDPQGLVAMQYPYAHVVGLPKSNGQRVNVSWPIRNNGTVPGFVQVRVALSGGGQTLGGVFTVQPGATVSATGFIDVVGQPFDVVVNGDTLVDELTAATGGAFVRTIAGHTFSIRTPPPPLPVLGAVGDPTIT